MAYIMFCLGEMKDCRDRSSSATLEHDLILSTSDTSRPLLKYVLSDGFGHLAHLGTGNAGIFKVMETFQTVILRHTLEWDRMCKLVPSVRPGIAWPGSEHDFTMYTLLAFGSDPLFHTFLDHSVFAPREGTNPLVYAAQFGKIDHARALILWGANVNHQGLLVDKLAVGNSDADDADADKSDTDIDDLDSDTPNADSSSERKAMPVEVAVDHWHGEMFDLLLAQGSTIPDGLLTRVLRVHPHRFPLYIIRRLLQTAELAKWAVAPGENRRLLEAFVEDEEDCDQTFRGNDLMLSTRRLVDLGYGETLLLVAVEKGCIAVVRALFSINASVASDVSSPSQSHGGPSIQLYKKMNF